MVEMKLNEKLILQFEIKKKIYLTRGFKCKFQDENKYI